MLRVSRIPTARNSEDVIYVQRHPAYCLHYYDAIVFVLVRFRIRSGRLCSEGAISGHDSPNGTESGNERIDVATTSRPRIVLE